LQWFLRSVLFTVRLSNNEPNLEPRNTLNTRNEGHKILRILFRVFRVVRG